MPKYIVEVQKVILVQLEVHASNIEEAKEKALAGPNDMDAVIDYNQVERFVTNAWVTGGVD